MKAASEKTKVLRDKTKQPIETKVVFHSLQRSDLPIQLLGDLYKIIQKKRALVFPNSRGRVEEIAVKLKNAQKYGGHQSYYAHHSSINKELEKALNSIIFSIKKFDQLLFEYLEQKEQKIPVSKWRTYLSKELKQKLILVSYFDVAGAVEFLLGARLIRV